MPLPFDRQRPIMPQVVEALQRLQDNAEQLAHEREGQYSEPPPPYSSGEIWEPPLRRPPTPEPPGPPVVDEYYERLEKRIALMKSTPYNQFKSQAARERQRLEYQLGHARSGRRQTLLFDMSSDLKANPENNVRSRWVEQGIWGDEWGPAWPKDSHPLTAKWRYGEEAPDCVPHPGGRWGHEEYSPELEFETESESEPESELGTLGSAPRQPKPQQPRPRRRRRPLPTKLGPIPQYLIPGPTVRNPEASRPYNQFLYQISQEREWIKDELDYRARGTAADLDALAYQSVKDNWIEDKIWNPEWDLLPGMKWIYEETEGQGEVKAPAADGATVEQSHETVDDSRQETRGSLSAIFFAPTPSPNGANSLSDGSSAPTPRNAQASITEASSGGHPAVAPSVQGTQHTPRRSSRKRSRASDAVEVPQPKRLRRNRQDSALLRNVSDAPNGNRPQNSRNSRPIITRAMAKVKKLPGDRTAVPASSKKEGERIKSVSSPPRRSTRIAEQEKKRKANAAETLSSKPPRKKTTRKARSK